MSNVAKRNHHTEIREKVTYTVHTPIQKREKERQSQKYQINRRVQ